MRKMPAYNFTFILLLTLFVLLVYNASAMAIKSVNKKETVKRFQSIYASYSNALLKTVAQMGGNTGCYYISDGTGNHDFSNCDEFYKTFVSNLKVQKYCHGNALKDECIPVYESYTNKERCVGFSEEMLNEYDDAFVMPDGSNVIVYNVTKNDRRPIFAVDTNGFAKPNKAGEDLFSITIIKNSNGAIYFHPNISHCLPVSKGGIASITDVYK